MVVVIYYSSNQKLIQLAYIYLGTVKKESTEQVFSLGPSRQSILLVTAVKDDLLVMDIVLRVKRIPAFKRNSYFHWEAMMVGFLKGFTSRCTT